MIHRLIEPMTKKMYHHAVLHIYMSRTHRSTQYFSITLPPNVFKFQNNQYLSTIQHSTVLQETQLLKIQSIWPPHSCSPIGRYFLCLIHRFCQKLSHLPLDKNECVKRIRPIEQFLFQLLLHFTGKLSSSIIIATQGD